MSDDAPRPAVLPVLLSLIAGLGHLWMGRSRRGLGFFACAAVAWNLSLLSRIAPLSPLGTWTWQAGLAAGVGITAYAAFDAARLGFYLRLPAVRTRRKDLLEKGIRHYLRHEFAQARGCLDRMLDLDPADPVARLYLATLERRAGRSDRAIRHARAALSALPATPFRPEIEREIALAEEVHHGS